MEGVGGESAAAVCVGGAAAAVKGEKPQPPTFTSMQA